MSVYVDWLTNHGWVMHGKTVKSCHMFADSVPELMAMAKQIGLKESWFQNKPDFPHFDLVESKRIQAVATGAIELIQPKEWQAKIRELRAKAQEGQG